MSNVVNEEQIRELAAKPGMTYTRMAKALQIDRNQAKKQCEDLGITLGKKQTKEPEVNVKTEPVNRDLLLERIEALEKKYEAELNKLKHLVDDLGTWAENELGVVRSRVEKHTHVILNYHDGKEFLDKKRAEREMRNQGI